METRVPQSFCNLIYHIVFSTKDWRPWLDDAIRGRVHEYLGGAVRGEGGMALAINGTPDHVHILARLRQDKAVSDVVRDLKSNASGWIHKTFPNHADFAWQSGYGAFTVSQSQLEKARAYIANQEAHHKKLTFKEEYEALLKAHGIDFKEEFLWQ